jgi:hypothetical protein
MTLVASPGVNATFNGTITGTNLVVNSGLVGTIQVGQFLYDVSNAVIQTVIVSGSGTNWVVQDSQFVGPLNMISKTFNCGFDVFWDGTGDSSPNADEFRNIRFEGGNIGCAAGDSPNLGSEMIWIGCDFIGCIDSGLGVFQQNGLDYTVLGGSCINCGVGLNSRAAGSITFTSGMRFSGSTICDIDNTALQGIAVEGCVSNSTYFCSNVATLKAISCTIAPASPGAIENAALGGSDVLDGCIVTNAVAQKSGSGVFYTRGNVLPGTFISGSGGSPTNPEPN